MFLTSQPQNPQASHRCIAGSWGHPSLWSLLAAVPALRLRPWVVHHCHQRPLTQPRQEGYVEWWWWWWWWWWRWLLRGFWRGFYRVNSMNATQKGSHGLKWSTRPWIPPSLLHAPKPSWKKGLRWPPPTKRHLRKINSCAVETSREEQISGATDTYISRNPKGTLTILWKQHSISMFCGNQQISWVLFQQGTCGTVATGSTLHHLLGIPTRFGRPAQTLGQFSSTFSWHIPPCPCCASVYINVA